jgi:hypothetical protein
LVAAEGSARGAVAVATTPAAEAPAAATRADPIVAVLVAAAQGEIGRFTSSDLRF